MGFRGVWLVVGALFGLAFSLGGVGVDVASL